MFKSIIKFFWPQRDFERDPEVVAATQIFLYTTLVVLFIRGSIFLYYLTTPLGQVLSLPGLQILLLAVGVMIFRYQQKLDIAAHFPAIGYVVMAIPTMWVTEGIHSPVIITLPVVVFYIMAVLGFRWAIIWTLILSAMVVGYFILAENDMLPPNRLKHEEIHRFVLLNYVAGVLLFIWLYAVYDNVFIKLKSILRAQRQESADVLRIISHDLRSPLQIIQSYGQLLIDNPTKEKAYEYTQHIQRSLDRIAGVLNHIQSYESVMGGKKLIEPQPVDLVEAIDDMLDYVQSQYWTKKIKVEFNPPEGEAFWVLADKNALREQVLGNLLINAFKFTPRNGTIQIVLAKNQSVVSLVISDNGVGMSTDMLQSIFSFSKVSTRAGTDGEKGSGFGLPIAKMFLDQMKIDIQVESRENHGTTISLQFKAAEPQVL